VILLVLALAAAVYAAAFLIRVVWGIAIDYRNHVLSEPDGPRCKDCLRCASCRRVMNEDGTPKSTLRTVPKA
jgi:hypothetical protein